MKENGQGNEETHKASEKEFILAYLKQHCSNVA